MSDFMTHVAAIAIGVAITLFLVGGFNNATATASAKDNKEDTTGGGNNNKKKNRKKNKKKTTTSTVDDDLPPSPASPPPAAFKAVPVIPKADPVAVEEEKKAIKEFLNGGKKKKPKKKKGGNNANGTTPAAPAPAPAPTPAPAPAPAANKPKAKLAPTTYVQPLQARNVIEEEWESVPIQKKKKKFKKVAAEAAGAVAPGAPVPKETVTIDGSRVGIIIGPKGATMMAIQERTGVKLDVNAPKQEESSGGGGGNQFRPVQGGKKKKVTATVVITEGTNESRVIAKKAILELADRGYAALLQGDQFGESTVSVHPKYMSEIVGTGGKIIKAIQSELDVKLTIPKTDWTPKSIQVGNIQPTCRVGIAGDDPRNVKTAKQVIKDICNYHHHEITHPGFSHEEVFVPQEFFHCVIGARGSEIKHIRGNYKVDVYMPSSDSVSENVVCVGRPNDVEKAISYIKLLMDRDSELREEKYSDEHYGNDADGW